MIKFTVNRFIRDPWDLEKGREVSVSRSRVVERTVEVKDDF